MPQGKTETTAPMTNGLDMFESFKAASSFNQSMMNSVFECCHELNQFLAGRFEKDAELQRSLASVNSPTEAMEISAAFARDAMQDYLEEMNRFAALAAETGRRNFQEMNGDAPDIDIKPAKAEPAAKAAESTSPAQSAEPAGPASKSGAPAAASTAEKVNAKSAPKETGKSE